MRPLLTFALMLLLLIGSQAGAGSFADTLQFRLIKPIGSSTIMFAGDRDTIVFEMLTEEKKRATPKPMLRISDSKGHTYLVSTYFSGFGYHITKNPQDSLISLYRDLPYGELIIDGLPKADQIKNDLDVPSLSCVVSINGIRGKPTLDQGGKTIDTEKSKKPEIKEILVTNKNGDTIFCRAKKEVSASGEMIHSLDFNTVNSVQLDERLKLTVLFIFWMYHKKV